MFSFFHVYCFIPQSTIRAIWIERPRKCILCRLSQVLCLAHPPNNSPMMLRLCVPSMFISFGLTLHVKNYINKKQTVCGNLLPPHWYKLSAQRFPKEIYVFHCARIPCNNYIYHSFSVNLYKHRAHRVSAISSDLTCTKFASEICWFQLKPADLRCKSRAWEIGRNVQKSIYSPRAGLFLEICWFQLKPSGLQVKADFRA